MLSPVRIQAGISTEGCLSWSSDGELAIAAGEEVYLLIPNRDGEEPWTHVRLHVNRFRTDEWPWPIQTSFETMSIGEEQARVNVVALAWSPPGIAKHRRSVLAVLTTNLLLSLWAHHGNPDDHKSWERILIVNEPSILPEVLPEELRASHLRRIRSMAWMPTCPQYCEPQDPVPVRKWGPFFLVVADDSNYIYLLAVSSPFLDPTKPWECQTLLGKMLFSLQSVSNRPSRFSMAMKRKPLVDHIEFGVWHSDNTIPLFYRSAGITRRARLDIAFEPSIKIGLTEDHDQPLEISSNVSSMPSSFSAQMHKEKTKYSAEKNLRDKVKAKVWGSASFDDLIATCITLHPAYSVEFMQMHEGSAVILFENATNDNVRDQFPWRVAPASDSCKTQSTILAWIMNNYHSHSLAMTDFDYNILYAATCAACLLENTKRPQLLKISKATLGYLQDVTAYRLQAELQIVDACQEQPTMRPSEIVQALQQVTIATGQRSFECGRPLLGICPFCPEITTTPISFTDLREAFCTRRHPFSQSSSPLITCLFH